MKNIFDKTIVILIIFTMIMAQFLFVGKACVSYAVDMIETSNKNVKISAYFVNSNGEKVSNIDAKINSTDLKLITEISVENDNNLGGYFDGNITLGNTNFKFKDNENLSVHVNSGETKTIEKSIEYLETENLTPSYLTQQTEIFLNGKYVNSKKEYNITGNVSVNLNWVTPEESTAQLSMKVLTNSTYKINDKNRRLVQLLIASKLQDNSYPVKNTEIELNVPNGVETVKVHKRNTYATNGNKDITNSNYKYDGDNTKATINIENTEENGKISWVKNSYDIIVVTYVFAENTEFTNAEITASSKLTTFDGKELSGESKVLVQDEIDGIVTENIIENEKSIYKGNLYTKNQRTIQSTSSVYIDYIDSLNSVQINESQPVFVSGDNEKNANIQYKKILVSAEEFSRILGNDGSISILDKQNNVLGNITATSQQNENSEYVIEYENMVNEVVIITSKPITTGILNIKHEKIIGENDLSREEIQSLTGIKNKSSIIYSKSDENVNAINTESIINLEETESKVDVEFDAKSLSTTAANQTLNMNITLETNDETKDLYKNPEIKVIFPKQIKGLEIEYNLIHDNELSIDKENSRLDEENGQLVFTMKINGEQTHYSEEALKGAVATLNIKNIVIDKYVPSSNENIIVNFTNENAVKLINNGTISKPISIIAENSLIYTNDAQVSDISTFENEGTKVIQLNTNEEKNEKITSKIINNENSKINDVKILGKIPTKENQIIRTSDINVSKNAKIYYTTNENPTTDLSDVNNGWSEENNENAKCYLINIDNMENTEEVDLSYNLKITKDIDYNVTEDAKYNISYTPETTGILAQYDSSILRFTTGSSAVLEENISAIVGNDILQDGAEVKSGEIIKYNINIKNSGTEDAENVSVNANIPDNTTLLELNKDYTYNEMYDERDPSEVPLGYYLEKSEKQVNFENLTIKSGDTINLSYLVKVNKDITDDTIVKSDITLNYKGEDKVSTITHKLKTAKIALLMKPSSRFETEILQSRSSYGYLLDVTNMSGEEQNNVKININTNDIMEVSDISYTVGEETKNYDKQSKEITIEKIGAGETVTIVILANMKLPTDEIDTTHIFATMQDGESIIRSNVVKEKVEGIDVVANIDTKVSQETGYLKPGEKIMYTIKLENKGKKDAEQLKIEDNFSDYLDILELSLNGQKCEYETRLVSGENYSTIIVNTSLKAGESAEIVIKAEVNSWIANDKQIDIINNVSVFSDTLLSQAEASTYHIEAKNDPSGDYKEIEEVEPIAPWENEDNSGDSGNNSGDNSDNNSEKAYVSGIVWLDEDKNGAKDENEQKIEGITVYGVNIKTNEIAKDENNNEIKTTTNSDGYYSLELPKGDYVIVFEYDTTKYNITQYKAENVAQSNNSKAIKSSINLNGENKDVATTDTINLTTSYADINLGLTEYKNFNLEIKKYVSKIVVTNKKGTETYDQKDGQTLAKVEIGSKVLSGSNVTIEYTIRITNTGSNLGYAKNVKDYLPKELNFSSELNSDWYLSGDELNNNSLANTVINPGETKDLKLVLTKTMTSSNTGLINNRAEITESYSAEGSDNNDSDNIGAADVILGIKTGGVQIAIYTSLIILIIIGIGYVINKRFLKIKFKDIF